MPGELFARGAVDWPDDYRCLQLPDNDTRWMNEVLWRWAVHKRNPVIKTSKRELAVRSHVQESKVNYCVQAMTNVDLIALTQMQALIVRGVEKKHARLRWDAHEPGYQYNPWAVDGEHVWQPGVRLRCAGTHSEARVPPADRDEPSFVDHLADYPLLADDYDYIWELLVKTNPKAQQPQPRTLRDADARLTLNRLIRKDNYAEQDVVDILEWLFLDEHRDALFWQKQVYSLAAIRQRKSSEDPLTKFDKIAEAWEAAGGQEAADERRANLAAFEKALKGD